MEQAITKDLEGPRFEEFGPLVIAGLGETYKAAGGAAIPAQWQRFVPYLGRIPGQRGGMTYGVICNGDHAGNWDYICGVEVADSSNQPAEFSRVTLPQKKYAVFSHRGHISTIRGTWDGIWGQWAPTAGMRIASAPRFERYSESFDPTGMGGVEIWIPL